MDADETLVKERFDAAVGGVSPDVVSMVGGGVAVGRGIRRRRRLVGAGGATATAAVVVGVLVATGGLRSLFDSKGAGPAQITQRVDATPRGMAAAVLTHTDGLGSLIGVGGQALENSRGMLDLKHGITAEFGYALGSGAKVDLQVIASRPSAKERKAFLCANRSSTVTCRETTFPDGTRGAVISSTDGLLGVANVRDSQVVIVLETVINSGSTPLSVQDLKAIATDPLVGLTTTADLNAQGLAIPDFKSTLTTSSGGSSSGSSTSSVSPPPVSVSSSAVRKPGS